MNFHEEINCWVYEGKYMGKDKPIQFVKSILEIIKTRFENDNEDDIKNKDFWKEDELSMNRSYGKEVDDLNIEINGANPYLLKSNMCACSQPIKIFRYMTYKRTFTFRVGCDCIHKNIDEELAKYSEKALKQIIKELKGKKEKIRLREEFEKSMKELKIRNEIRRVKVNHYRMMKEFLSIPEYRFLKDEYDGVVTCKRCKSKHDKLESCWMCDLSLQKCLDCDGWLPQSDYFVRCPECFKKFIRSKKSLL